jgi:hypothetical protein
MGPLSNILWAFWALPEIGEEGTFTQTIQWIGTQALLPCLFAALLLAGLRIVFWPLLIYSAFMILFGIGLFGWALMGPGTPASIYAVCATLLAMGFGILYHSLKDLGIGTKERKYASEDERE